MALGMRSLLEQLFGLDNGGELLDKNAGKKINEVSLNKEEDANRLLIRFTDSTAISIQDEGQNCCEHRYMTCDDDLAYFAGAEFIGIEIRDVSSTTDQYDECDEVQFLIVKTSKGEFTCETHNEHNGYYGGFSIRVSEVP
jgi:hypothetical protein